MVSKCVIFGRYSNYHDIISTLNTLIDIEDIQDQICEVLIEMSKPDCSEETRCEAVFVSQIGSVMFCDTRINYLMYHLPVEKLYY